MVERYICQSTDCIQNYFLGPIRMAFSPDCTQTHLLEAISIVFSAVCIQKHLLGPTH